MPSQIAVFLRFVDETERRAEIARRLKAARWLFGEHREKRSGKGFEAVSLSAEKLAELEPLPSNEITAYRIGTIERMEHHTPPMELNAIADALGIAHAYFRPEDGPVLQRTGEASSTEVADLLHRQSLILERIEDATAGADGVMKTISGLIGQARLDLPRVAPRDPTSEDSEPGPSDNPQASS